MSTNSSSRKRASLAFGTAVALTAASLTIGVSPASALTYATVTEHDTIDSNNASDWCPQGTTAFKAESGGDSDTRPYSDFGTLSADGRTFLLGGDADPVAPGTQPFVKVVVKAGADPSTKVVNTVFGDPPVAGQTVWADSDGRSLYQSDGPSEDDKSISHIIVCAGPTPPPPAPGNVEAVKQWTYTGADPSTAPGFVVGTPGTLTFNDVAQKWTDNTTEYAAGTEVTVEEAGVGTPPTATGYQCTVVNGATTYTVGTSTTPTPPTVTVASGTTITVTITNTANCTTVTPAPGNVEAVKQWTYTGADPSKAQDFVVGTPGTLTFNDVKKEWTDNTTEYAAGTEVTVEEAGVGTPPTATGYQCTVVNGATTYTVGTSTTPTPPTVTVASGTTITVTIINTANCAPVTVAVIPPVVIPPVVTPPAVAPPAVTPPVVEEVVDEADVAAEEDVVEEDEETAVAGSEDELAATGGSTSAALLGALLVLSGAALIGSRRRFGMTD